MIKLTRFLLVISAMLLAQIAITAQTTGSIVGTVLDPNGEVVAGATVKVKGVGGQDFSVVTNDNGTYRVPAVPNGLYTVSVNQKGFKTTTVNNVKVDVGTPITVDVRLEIGGLGEVVNVASGGEVLQTQTATVGSTIQGRQIVETPLASRDALDLVGLLPGTATVGRPRTGTINGLPKGALTITIDGVDVQTNDTRTSDGFFTYVRPRLDAIEEVTVSTASPGAESSGDGAVQIKFVTKRGNNDYSYGGFMQHRNEAFNTNYWFLNSNPVGVYPNGTATKQKIRLFQYGGHAGGPIPFLQFGEGKKAIDSGKDKRYFFVNYEEFRLPQALIRPPRKAPTADLANGIYKYRVSAPTNGNPLPSGCTAFGTGQMECAVNIYSVAAAAGQLSTPDPIVQKMFNKIRAGLAGQNVTPIASNPNLVDYNLTAVSNDVRKFTTVRIDYNLTKKHSAEFVMNRQQFGGFPDILNSQEPTYPGFPGYSQESQRDSYTFAVRSTFSSNIVNEARYAVQVGGPSIFRKEGNAAAFADNGGYSFSIAATVGGTAITNPNITNSNQIGKNPVYDFTDSVTWVKGNHAINFGGQFKRIIAEGNTTSRFVPSIGFGIDGTETTILNMFSFCTANNAATTPTCRLPGGTATQQGEARVLWAVLVGHIASYTNTAYLNTDTRKYEEFIPRHRLAEQRTYGLFVQDNWKVRNNLSINYGVRWQPQTGYVAKTYGNYTKLENFAQLYGASGVGNLFKPGATGGQAPRVVPIEVGESAFPTDWNNFAPSVGVVWSPNFGEKGLMRRVFGKSGSSVFRAGYSVAFVREGTNLLELINGANPGGTRALSRSSTIAGSFTPGTNLRDPNNPNLSPFDPLKLLKSEPVFPITLTTADASNAYDPNIKTGEVKSYNFSYQRELDRNTVLEARYVGNMGTGIQRQVNLNEFNVIENGFLNEFKLAQANLYANIASGNGASGFAYRGAGTGTSPLPIMLAYFQNFGSAAALQAASLVPANYTAANFANTTLMAALNRNAPNVGTFNGTNFENNATRRANAIANGLPANFFYVAPEVSGGGAWLVENTQRTWYNSMVIELRRRLSNGLRVNANYVWSKALADAFTADAGGGGGQPPTSRPEGYKLAKNVQISDLRHQFKLDTTYDFPFGKSRTGFAKFALAGWSLSPTVRWQSGSPITFGNLQLVGMDRKEFQSMIKVRKDTTNGIVYWLPDDVILNSQKAFNTSLVISGSTISNNGYGTTFGTGGPTGKFLAPAGYNNCIQAYGGQCGFQNLVVYGPSFFKMDASLSKKFLVGEKRSVELRMMVLDVLNHPNFRVGGWAGDTGGGGCCGTTFGQFTTTSAYQDTSTTNDVGGRIIDFMLRINW